jgi:uncharacterized pyridoxal phosphate-containing UPF0001 family protein
VKIETSFSDEHLDRLTEQVTRRLGELRRRIESTGGADGVRVVAVTKTFGLDAVIAAGRAGITDIGENYADELVAKALALQQRSAEPVPRWHFLGAIQQNKINRLRNIVGLYQGVDRLVEGEAIARRSPGASILVEVDTARTEGRGGVVLEEVSGLIERLRGLNLVVEGLMTVAPPGPEAARAFRQVSTLRAELGLIEASMGMSEDLELAVVEGATMIRVGRALFGPRIVDQ